MGGLHCETHFDDVWGSLSFIDTLINEKSLDAKDLCSKMKPSRSFGWTYVHCWCWVKPPKLSFGQSQTPLHYTKIGCFGTTWTFDHKMSKVGWNSLLKHGLLRDFYVDYFHKNSSLLLDAFAVIDDKTCEERLWVMKKQGEMNFYMCEISREMVIDATFKGNLSRYINHSCHPNSELQKWWVLVHIWRM